MYTQTCKHIPLNSSTDFESFSLCVFCWCNPESAADLLTPLTPHNPIWAQRSLIFRDFCCLIGQKRKHEVILK